MERERYISTETGYMAEIGGFRTVRIGAEASS